MKYQNISDSDLTIIGFGHVKAGETIETKTPINNPNFKLVKEPESKPSTDTAEKKDEKPSDDKKTK